MKCGMASATTSSAATSRCNLSLPPPNYLHEKCGMIRILFHHINHSTIPKRSLAYHKVPMHSVPFGQRHEFVHLNFHYTTLYQEVSRMYIRLYLLYMHITTLPQMVIGSHSNLNYISQFDQHH